MDNHSKEQEPSIYAYGEAPAGTIVLCKSFPANRDAGESFQTESFILFRCCQLLFQDKYIFNLLGEMTVHLDLHLVTDLVISSLMELLGTFQNENFLLIIQL